MLWSGQHGGTAISWCVSFYVACDELATGPSCLTSPLDSWERLQQTATLSAGGSG